MSSSSSKPGSSSKAAPSSKISADIAAEIAYLMRTPGALSHELERTPRGVGRGHYDPNQPRVPAGDPKGGQFASKGYRGGASGLDARFTQASLDGAQLAQLGQGNPRDAYAQAQPFDGLFDHITTAQHLASQNGFIRADRDRQRNRDMQDFNTDDGRYKFRAQGAAAPPERPLASDGSSRQPSMLMTTPPARTPQFWQLLRVQ